jgi:hypothetical protein
MLSVTPPGQKSRRLESNQHEPAYETGAWPFEPRRQNQGGLGGVEPAT